MNVLFFLKERTNFIRQFYTTTSGPYNELIRKNVEGEEPFVSQSWDDEGEFYPEWKEAQDSLHIIGSSCVSMLSAALKLYLESWEREAVGIVSKDPEREKLDMEYKKYWENRKREFKRGPLYGYMYSFAQHLSIYFETYPGNLSMLEEIILARNKFQHLPSITGFETSYNDSDLKKLKNNPFFLNEVELNSIGDIDEENLFWLKWLNLDISQEQLFTAISQVECFAVWLDSEIKTAKHWAI